MLLDFLPSAGEACGHEHGDGTAMAFGRQRREESERGGGEWIGFGGGGGLSRGAAGVGRPAGWLAGPVGPAGGVFYFIFLALFLFTFFIYYFLFYFGYTYYSFYKIQNKLLKYRYNISH